MPFLTISSARRNTSASASSSDFLCSLSIPTQPFSSATLRDVLFPNTLYRITSSNCSIPFYDVTGTTAYSATIPSGFYTISSLATQVVTQMKSQKDLTWTCSYSSDTGLITIGAASNFKLQFSSGATASTSAATVLGYAKSDTASATSAVATSVPNLYTPLSIYISVVELGSNCYSTGGAIASYRAPLTVASNSILTYSSGAYYDQTIRFSSPITLNSIRVRIFDDQGNILQMNGADWEFTIEIV